jgi:hypothetical protein
MAPIPRFAVDKRSHQIVLLRAMSTVKNRHLRDQSSIRFICGVVLACGNSPKTRVPMRSAVRLSKPIPAGLRTSIHRNFD